MLSRSLAPALAILAAASGTLVRAPETARADTCPAIRDGGDRLREVDAAARLTFVENVLARETRRARRWRIAWGVGLGVIGAGQLALGLWPDVSPTELDDAGEKSMYVGAAKSFVGAGSSVFTPLRIPRAKPLENPDPCTALAEAERALIAAARNERNQVLLGHAGSFALSVGSILVLGVGYGYWKEAAFSVASGTAVGLLRTWTQPKGAIHALRRYRRGEISGPEVGPAPRAWQVVPVLGPSDIGLQIAGEF